MADSSVSLVNTASNTDTFGSWISKTNQLINALAQEVVTANSQAGGSKTTGNAYVTGIFGADTLTANTALRGGNVTVSNVLFITSNVSVGNSTVNTLVGYATLSTGLPTLNSTVLVVGANVVVNSSSLDVGNSTVYSFVNSSIATVSGQVQVGLGAPNAVINTTTLAIGNSTVWSTLNAIAINVASLSVPSGPTVNSTGIWFGSTQVSSISVTTAGTSAQLLDSWALATWRSAKYAYQVTDNAANGYQCGEILAIQDGTSAYSTEYARMTSNALLATVSANANSTYVTVWVTPVSANTTVRLTRAVAAV